MVDDTMATTPNNPCDKEKYDTFYKSPACLCINIAHNLYIVVFLKIISKYIKYIIYAMKAGY